jgi:hypothetical protein
MDILLLLLSSTPEIDVMGRDELEFELKGDR